MEYLLAVITRSLLGDILVVIISFLLIMLYFLPSIVAAMRENTNFKTIFVVNLFTGWTIYGWVLSLAWSLTHNKNEG